MLNSQLLSHYLVPKVPEGKSIPELESEGKHRLKSYGLRGKKLVEAAKMWAKSAHMFYQQSGGKPLAPFVEELDSKVVEEVNSRFGTTGAGLTRNARTVSRAQK